MQDISCNLLFVYGTLMQGMGNPFSEQLSTASDFLCPATVQGRLYDVRGEYPCAVASLDPKELIYGELYRLNDPTTLFQTLDPYEDCYPEDAHRSLYIRRVTSVATREEQNLNAWIYFWNSLLDELIRIPSGNYRSCCHSLEDRAPNSGHSP
jgi:gamma-glutamylcyclotransferase (GGCT)/AIG2-like uncharacterized protein YtfP